MYTREFATPLAGADVGVAITNMWLLLARQEIRFRILKPPVKAAFGFEDSGECGAWTMQTSMQCIPVGETLRTRIVLSTATIRTGPEAACSHCRERAPLDRDWEDPRDWVEPSFGTADSPRSMAQVHSSVTFRLRPPVQDGPRVDVTATRMSRTDSRDWFDSEGVATRVASRVQVSPE